MKRTRDLAGKTAVASAALALCLAGCSYTSPSTITTPYPAADGVSGSIGSTPVGLRNFMVIGTAKGAPAEVLGVLVNDGASPVQVSLSAELGASAQASQTVFQVPAHGILEIGPEHTTHLQITDLPVQPGALTGINAATPAGGSTQLDVPVLLPVGAYANMTPAPTPPAEPSQSPAAQPSPSPTAS